jgi:hypothetical protein
VWYLKVFLGHVGQRGPHLVGEPGAAGPAQRAYDLFLQNLVKGTSHLPLGQEAIAAAFGVAMRPDDYTFAAYRGHAHTLARGVPMGPVLAELLGRENGLMAGKGGSMHLTSVEHGVMGSYAIIGAHLPIACGAAWSAQYRGTDQVAVCFFGDGTTNIGAFHEALNFAAIWTLPVVFVCENNLYMEYTRTSTITAVDRPAADRAAAYGLEPVVADGNDADAMYQVATAALERARAGTLEAERGWQNHLALTRGETLSELTITARDVVRMATIEGARTLGLADRIGSLTPGNQADIILLDVDLPNLSLVNNLPAAVTLSDNHNVETVFIAGKPVKAAGRVLGHDLRAVRRLALDSRDRLLRDWSGPGFVDHLAGPTADARRPTHATTISNI